MKPQANFTEFSINFFAQDAVNHYGYKIDQNHQQINGNQKQMNNW